MDLLQIFVNCGYYTNDKWLIFRDYPFKSFLKLFDFSLIADSNLKLGIPELLADQTYRIFKSLDFLPQTLLTPHTTISPFIHLCLIIVEVHEYSFAISP